MQAKANNVDDYIARFPPAVRKRLDDIRATIKAIVPQAEERISYGMPGYYLNGQLVFFAAFAKHIGFYALPQGNEAFRSEIARYKTGKGSIQFPLDEALPLALISNIVSMRVSENLAKTPPKKK
ncbi:iron chaperone [Flavobacterium selenitireducens]|uniref:iron chaperone n=1 Tax=Flavobacterium selenitireducens TaxID=2722704 RepID=UPI00168B1E20|nr:DUF1801 domain-containing protein [Flavobacterium selenitireducens]MBD3583005.1 hypothetical protein [Flavobacterium selenitireducens]